MATAKKTSHKAPAKKATTKRAPAKASAHTKVVHKPAPKQAEMKSFKRANSPTPFFTFELTKQTLYWAILCGVVLALGVWVMSISIEVNKIYDQIDSTNQVIDETE
jgi:hypothetical protein